MDETHKQSLRLGDYFWVYVNQERAAWRAKDTEAPEYLISRVLALKWSLMPKQWKMAYKYQAKIKSPIKTDPRATVAEGSKPKLTARIGQGYSLKKLLRGIEISKYKQHTETIKQRIYPHTQLRTRKRVTVQEHENPINIFTDKRQSINQILQNPQDAATQKAAKAISLENTQGSAESNKIISSVCISGIYVVCCLSPREIVVIDTRQKIRGSYDISTLDSILINENCSGIYPVNLQESEEFLVVGSNHTIARFNVYSKSPIAFYEYSRQPTKMVVVLHQGERLLYAFTNADYLEIYSLDIQKHRKPIISTALSKLDFHSHMKLLEPNAKLVQVSPFIFRDSKKYLALFYSTGFVAKLDLELTEITTGTNVLVRDMEFQTKPTYLCDGGESLWVKEKDEISEYRDLVIKKYYQIVRKQNDQQPARQEPEKKSNGNPPAARTFYVVEELYFKKIEITESRQVSIEVLGNLSRQCKWHYETSTPGQHLFVGESWIQVIDVSSWSVVYELSLKPLK